MSSKINERYIKEFFGIGDDPDGLQEFAEIKAKLVRLTFENNENICMVDDEPDGMFFLESGTAIVLDRSGERVNILSVGQYFGEYGALTGQKRLTTVRSMGRTVVYKLSSEDVVKFLSKHPEIYGELMKRVYDQVSHKHAQILALSGMRKGVLSVPSNQAPLSKKRVIIQYGIVLLLFLLSALLVPANATAPVFILPLVFMLVYVLITKRTVESLLLASSLAALLVYRTGIFASFADALMSTMGAADNVFTVLVMALMGGMINLIVVSGGVTAFEKLASRIGHTKRGVFLTSLGIMTATSIDDGLNMLSASYASYQKAKETGIVREKLALFYSMLPTVLCSFFPLSLWGIFVIGTLSATVKVDTVETFCASVPFNVFSIVTVIVMVLFAIGKLPLSKQLKDADKRYEETGVLWPAGSDRYLSVHDTEVWGKISNVMLPIAVLAVSSLAIRSFINKSFVVDSAVGLMVTLAFMFILYCFRGIMSPEQFIDHMITGIAGSTLPIILYLLTMCFSSLLDCLNLAEYFEGIIDIFDTTAFLLPACAFLFSLLLTVVLGSSWAMYAIAFPIVLGFVTRLGLNPALFIGAVSGAGIAGEKLCPFTAESMNVATAVGLNPRDARVVRMSYSAAVAGITTVVYLILGIWVRA
ncbi:MAG: cyclic nucleotide-binding domain-containing protein [Lachnospiraceae bacterium]|nr:cyclic nucleotide-binding domain-containing protein [Lachnospiraceae bacterium]